MQKSLRLRQLTVFSFDVDGAAERIHGAQGNAERRDLHGFGQCSRRRATIPVSSRWLSGQHRQNYIPGSISE